jgi:hypothetical protein
MAISRSCQVFTARPATRVTRSPGRTSIFSAAEPFITTPIVGG